MIITVGGDIGSGKSTLARSLAGELRLEYNSVGEILRKMADSRGISLLEMSNLAEKDEKIDRELDCRQKEIAKKGNCVIDSRLGAYFIPADFKIWLSVSPEIRPKRVAERDGVSEDEAKNKIIARRKSENGRYADIYGIKLEDTSVYDLVLDTDNLSKEEVLKETLIALGKKGM